VSRLPFSSQHDVNRWKDNSGTPGRFERNTQRGKGLLFTYNNKKPISARHLQQRFSEALIAIDVKSEEQARRGLTFHALRVTFNTLIRSAGVMDSKIQAAVGHTSTAMTDRYTNFALEDLTDLRLAVESIFLQTK
jgi:integrase